MKKDQEKRQVLFTFEGQEYYKNSIYRVRDKQDLNAPEAYKKLGATRLPSRGIDETFSMSFDHQSEVYDTGFNELSACFRKLTPTDAALEAKARVANILKPYLKAVGSDADISKIHSNFDFWEHKTRLFRIDSNIILNTADPIQAMTLYAAVMALTVAPENDEKNPRYTNTAYVITDSDGKKNSKNETVIAKGKATKRYLEMMESKKAILISILRYMNVKVSDNTAEDSLILIQEDLFSKPEKVNEFINLYDKSVDPNFVDEMVIYKKISGNGKVKLGKDNRQWYTINNISIGPDLKTAARNIATTDELQEVKDTILLD